jgi:putative aminopeptidase FrvX
MNRSIAIVIVAPLDEPGFVVSAITSGSKIQSRVTFAWTVAEETGLAGATSFSAGGSVNVGLSWPGRYWHSPVEVMDLRDLDALTALIAALVNSN